MVVIDNPECDFMSWQKPSAEEVSYSVEAIWLKKVTSLHVQIHSVVMLQNLRKKSRLTKKQYDNIAKECCGKVV